MRQTTYSLALPVYIPTFLLSVGTGVLIPTLPLYAKSYGVSNTLLAATIHVFPALVLLRLISGIASAMWNISRMAYLTDVVPLRDRGRALSMFGGVSRIGVFIGPAVGGVVAQAFGLTSAFYISAGAAGIAALISLFFTHETRHV